MFLNVRTGMELNHCWSQCMPAHTSYHPSPVWRLILSIYAVRGESWRKLFFSIFSVQSVFVFPGKKILFPTFYMQQLQENEWKKLSPQQVAPLVTKMWVVKAWLCAAEIFHSVSQCLISRATDCLVEVAYSQTASLQQAWCTPHATETF